MISDERSEKMIIASILYNHDSDVCKGLALDAIAGVDESCFSNLYRREIFNGIKRSIDKGCTPDFANISSIVSDDSVLHICELSSHSTTNDLTIAISAVQDTARARKIEEFALGIPGRLSESNSICDTLQDVYREMTQLSGATGKKSTDEGWMHEFVGDWFKVKEEQMKTGETGFLFSGIPSLDRAIGGFRGGDIVVIPGRTGMGKSSLATTFIVNQLLGGFKIALFSLELCRVEIFDKCVSMISDLTGQMIPFRNIHNPAGAFGGVGLSASQLNRVSEVVFGPMKNTRFYARGTGRISVEDIMATTRKLVHSGECNALYIDHLGLLVRDKNKEREELTHITNSLRIFAGEMDIPIFEVVQMNRTADTTKEKPRTGSMKGSGSIEEDASIIIAPWRPFAIDKDKYEQSEAELIVIKGRNGGEGTIPSHFCTETTRFTERLKENEQKKDRGMGAWNGDRF